LLHHDARLLVDGIAVRLHVAAELLLRLAGVELRVPLDRLDQPVVAAHGRIAEKHVQDEAFVDGLLHAVDVERAMLDLAVFLERLPEELQRLVLGRGGEGEVAGVRQELLGLDQAVDQVLDRLVLLFRARLRQADRHLRARTAALAGVRLVDDDGEPPMAVLVADGVEDEGKLLYRRDDDLLAAFDVLAQVR
jgi:hypothetical protein